MPDSEGNGEQLRLLHLTASPSYGGPERQMLELGGEMAPEWRSVYASFREEDRCWDFIRQARAAGFEAAALQSDTPHLPAAVREVRQRLQEWSVDVLICHGYKANMVGRMAARSLRIPVIAVSRGWTGESWRVRVFDFLDRLHLRFMDHVVAVSQAQAARIRQAGVARARVSVIHNAIRTERFAAPDMTYRSRLGDLFTRFPKYIVGAAGRLSPEKGFDVLVKAARILFHKQNFDFGLVIFGEGVLRRQLQEQIEKAGLSGRVVLGGYTDQLDRYMPHFVLFVQASHTEGLPNVLLEASAAGVAVVATDVGGTREVIRDDINGCLVPAGEPDQLAGRIAQLLAQPQILRTMGVAGRKLVESEFAVDAQARRYEALLESLLSQRAEVPASPVSVG